MSPIGHKCLVHHRNRGKFARKEKLSAYNESEIVDDGKPISARTQRSTVARHPNKKQYSRLRTSLPVYKRSPKKKVTAICSLCQTLNLMIKLTCQN